MIFRRHRIAVLGLALFLLGAQDVLAQDPPPWPEFTFRRIGVPPAGSTAPRINIQIERAPLGASPEAALAPIARGQSDQAAWFWDAVGDDLSGGAMRFRAALGLLERAPQAQGLRVANAEHLSRMARDHGAAILAASVDKQVSPALILSVMAVESAGRVAAQSTAGAQGLMQLIPATAARFNVGDPFDPAQNIAGGAAYLDWLMTHFDRDPILALAAYNAGEGAVRDAGGVPAFAETRDYVPKVLATWQLARLLCLTPPDLVSDGCVFRMMGGLAQGQ